MILTADELTSRRELADAMAEFLADLACWSQATFGADSERGPLGALHHLREEIDEVIAAPLDVLEYADCYILIRDAVRRAGITPMQLLAACRRKLMICKNAEFEVGDGTTPDRRIKRIKAPTPTVPAVAAPSSVEPSEFELLENAKQAADSLREILLEHKWFESVGISRDRKTLYLFTNAHYCFFEQELRFLRQVVDTPWLGYPIVECRVITPFEKPA